MVQLQSRLLGISDAVAGGEIPAWLTPGLIGATAAVLPQVTVGEMALSLSIVDGHGLKDGDGLQFSRENPAANAAVGTTESGEL